MRRVQSAVEGGLSMLGVATLVLGALDAVPEFAQPWLWVVVGVLLAGTPILVRLFRRGEDWWSTSGPVRRSRLVAEQAQLEQEQGDHQSTQQQLAQRETQLVALQRRQRLRNELFSLLKQGQLTLERFHNESLADAEPHSNQAGFANESLMEWVEAIARALQGDSHAVEAQSFRINPGEQQAMIASSKATIDAYSWRIGKLKTLLAPENRLWQA